VQDGTPLPTYVKKLYQHAEEALQHLFPDAVREDGILFADAIRVNLSSYRFKDFQNNEIGELHELWARVKGLDEKATEDDIEHWLLNLDLPDNMARFSFSDELMSNPEAMYGNRIEIFPEVYFYAGTTTLLAGYNGSGKSTMATQIAHIMATCGYTSFILSPEMPPAVTWHILGRQASSVREATPQENRRIRQHCGKNFVVSTIEDRLTPSMAIHQFDTAYALGHRVIILDSLTCVRTGHELYEQADFSDLLRNWSRSHPDCFLLVVAHMRKPQGYAGGQISRYDIRGAGEISDFAGHIWLMQRKNPFSDKEKNMYGDYDAKIIVDKNRATGKLVCKMLRFSNVQKLYHTTKQPERYIDYMNPENVERIY
jgi:hypothetical protein